MKIILPEYKLLQLKNALLDEVHSSLKNDSCTIGAESGGGNDDYFHIDENQEMEVDADEVSLNSFKKNDTLAPKIWNGMTLNPRVRLKLLDIADDFWDSCDLNWVKLKGIHLTGSICNFNWSKFSDIDLHLVVDFADVHERKDFVQEYFNSKKNEWNNEHDNLKMYGFPVEVYVEDIGAETQSNGLFNLETNAWIKAPSPDNIPSVELCKYEIKEKAANIMTRIDHYCDLLKFTNDKAKLRKIGKKARVLCKKIKAMRKFGLNRGGEGDPLNIIYKVIRRMGYLDKLWDISSILYDKLNSLNESKVYSFKNEIKRIINEEVVADGNAEHNPYEKKWEAERKTLISFLVNNGTLMTSKENGKQYFTYFDKTLSDAMGLNFVLCVQYNQQTLEPGSIVYIRALDKFTYRLFRPEFDTRGRDNVGGTGDDVSA